MKLTETEADDVYIEVTETPGIDRNGSGALALHYQRDHQFGIALASWRHLTGDGPGPAE